MDSPWSYSIGIKVHGPIPSIHPDLLDFAGTYDAKTGGPLKTLLDFKKPKERAPAENRGDQVSKFHGRSWLPLLEQKNADGWDQIGASHTFHEIQMYYPMRVVRENKLKLICSNILKLLSFLAVTNRKEN